jgi:hypothetical protein
MMKKFIYGVSFLALVVTFLLVNNVGVSLDFTSESEDDFSCGKQVELLDLTVDELNKLKFEKEYATFFFWTTWCGNV